MLQFYFKLTYNLYKSSYKSGLCAAPDKIISQEVRKIEKELTSKELIRFVESISKLEALYFMGVARVMDTAIVTPEGETRAMEDIMSDMIDKFISYNRAQRRNLMKIIKTVR